MPETADFRHQIRAAFAASGRELDSDIAEELAQHAAATYESARAEGADHDHAAREVHALIAAWSSDAERLRRRPTRPAVVLPPHADSRSWTGLGHDVIYALRVLRRQPGFALLAILTMALGTGATTILFSVAYGVLLKPLPWHESDRLVRVTESRQGHEPRIRGTITNATYIAWHAQPDTIEEIGGWLTSATTAIIGNGEPTRLQTTSVTPLLFAVLKAQPFRGRVFVEDDGTPGGGFPAKSFIILSYGFWQERYGGRDDAIGSVIRVGDRARTVIGVMPRGFVFPDRATRAWIPFAVPAVLDSQGTRRVTIFSALARLRPGASAAQASAEGTARARNAPDPGLAAVAMFGGNGPADINAVPALEMMTAEVKPALMLMLAAVILLLITATANVASLQLARATTRRREIAIRAAIGAGAGRLTRQLAVESVLVGAAGGLVGLAFAVALHRVLPTLLPADFPRLDDVTVDARVMLFSAGVSLVASVACSMLPALRARRLNVIEALADGAAAATSGGVLRSGTVRVRTAIMVAQVAVACVLLIGGALLARSFMALLNADRGYDPRNLLTARLPLPPQFSMARRTELLETLVARLRTTPGVSEAAFGNALPLVTAGGFRAFKMRPPVDPSVEVDVNAMQRVVSPGYFAALGLRLSAGRILGDGDTMASRMVIVVNQSFAAKYLGPQPLGAIVPNLGMCRGDNDRWEVVGVVDDMRQGGLALGNGSISPVNDARQPEIFMPYHQIGCEAAVPDPIIVARTVTDPAPFAATLRGFVRQEAPTIALDSVMTMEERLSNTLAKPRLYAMVLAGFGAFALAIAAVGLFGVLSYSVAQRSREIGVRTALGARPADIVRLVLRQFAVMSACGIVAGAWIAFAASRALTTVLYGVDPHDPLTFVAVPAVLAVVTTVACVVPARRAAKVDPVHALRAG